MRQDLLRIWSILAPKRAAYALGLFSLFIVNSCSTLAPVFLAVGVELTAAEFLQTPPKTPPLLSLLGLSATHFTLALTLTLFFCLHLVANIARYPMLMFVSVPSHALTQGLRNALVAKLLSLPRSFYDRAQSGDLMSRATSDVLAVRMMLGPGILVGIDTLLILSMVLCVLFLLSWKLTLLCLLPLPLISWITNKLSHAEYNAHSAVQDDLSSLTEFTRERFAGVRIIQAYARTSASISLFSSRSAQHMRKNLSLARVRSVFDPTLDLMLGSSTVLVLIFGGIDTLEGHLPISSFLSFLFLVSFLSGPMVGFGWSISLFQRGRASLQRIDALLREPSDIQDPPNPSPPPTATPTLHIRDLSFSYPFAPPPTSPAAAPRDTPHATPEISLDTPDPAPNPLPALQHISFSLPPGHSLGITGPIGSGKSTLASLLVRLYNPPKGSILLNDIDALDLSLDHLRRAIVLAPQDTLLFSDSIERNILLSPSAPPSSAPKYAALASLAPEIDALPSAYQTLLGERGLSLSGGQRQRLAIARALAAQPQILILDDCFSAVDAKTEAAILENLREIFQNNKENKSLSTIIISHRVRALQACDHIIVLHNGAISEQGSHLHLLSLQQHYATLAASQSDPPQPDAETL